ncbi:tRNA pseudouridine(55) synthase TruB [Iodobacter fluviatilis]|uniref:tRNA pseudouridine synthase B n=1 Tax=Iodobacter fluviatilis TaxID=537 RepID=A0A377Q7B4_9NEIS|nr:tRNA pseudouridine(55) synthase TruB [Iodobacter fluviatilis]TCU89443.1 tRNA pseudouridine synthase B [Iodobacter fluviatilis]STQ90813.1 tRNA pseudouridine synthase B [Iodobacter fluviatilis]
MAKRKIDGVLLLDKPFGISSNNALQKARWLLQAEKGGHTGVLDPFATGLLPLCFGEATKFAQRMLEADKGYRATIKLGEVSTTLDGEGEITKSGDAPSDAALIRAAVNAFIGPVTQTPPMYSALKFQGKALYEYARDGVEIERQSRQITIYSIDIISIEGDVLVIDVSCSKGTYIRVLAEDIGKALGCGAYLTGLRRTRTAGFLLENSVNLDDYNHVPVEARDAYLLPADCLLLDLPALFFDTAEFEKIRHGMTVERGGLLPGEYRLYAEGESRDNARFIGLGEVAAAAENPHAWLRPKRLLSGL